MNDAALARMQADRQWLVDHDGRVAAGALTPLLAQHRIVSRQDVDGGQILACACGAVRRVLFYDARRDAGAAA